ncbi:asparaginase [Rhodoferax lacus]|uniref:Asparaginase n=1 Tax=Rhodoferax lacus TaxID=2184758 RepID=A0A3E1RGE0_9BURK|nr:asparaginase [Rhodoferax lacus]RFO98446.1 asparaginase [Rhodoferax lacus]
MLKKVVFLGMGGTIAGTAQSAGDNVGYTAAQVGVAALLAGVPGLQQVLGDCQAESEQVCQIDSKDLAHADWQALLDRVTHYLAQPEVAGLVVTHGTDTLEETAFFLSQAVPAALLAHKPVVLTCAMRPASSLTPDGPANMADAVSVSLCPGARGVLVVCAGKIHGAAQVQKVHPYRVDAFDSGEAGPVGLVEEGRVRLLANWPGVDVERSPVDSAALQAQGWPRVEIVTSHAGASGAVVRALLGATAAQPPLRGIVVAGTGNGTVHKDMEVALQEAQAQGVRVVRVSRCAYGQVVGGSASARSGAFVAMEWSAVKARIALMLQIAVA